MEIFVALHCGGFPSTRFLWLSPGDLVGQRIFSRHVTNPPMIQREILKWIAQSIRTRFLFRQ
jgi:hypothetical protein